MASPSYTWLGGGGWQASSVGLDLRVGLQRPHQSPCLHGQTRADNCQLLTPKTLLLKLEMPLSRLDAPVIRPLGTCQMGADLGGRD